MSTNDFQVFAGGTGANVLSQADYLAYADKDTGFQSGVARSDAANKVFRQASIISAMVAQFIVDNAATDALDDGTIDTLKTNFATAINALITAAIGGLAPKASPALTGTPTAPTAAKGNSTTQLATTAFVATAVSDYAPKASPALTGTPTAPTAAASTNTTQIASCAFVQAAIDAALASYLPKNNPTFTGTMTGPAYDKEP